MDDARTDANDAFRALADLGPFFGLDVVREGDTSWRSLRATLSDAGYVDARVARNAVRLGWREPTARQRRTAASIAQLGILTRVMSPLLALAVMNRTVDDLWWEPGDTSIFSLGARGVRPLGDDESPTASMLTWSKRITLAHSDFHVSPQILDGNVVSAVNGAAWSMVRQAPTITDRVRQVARDAVAQISPRELYTGTIAGPDFTRTTCCQLYTTDGSLCPDCVLGSASRNN